MTPANLATRSRTLASSPPTIWDPQWVKIARGAVQCRREIRTPPARHHRAHVVGGLDHEVLALNRLALRQLACEKQSTVVPGATHLFEEPGTLDEVARLAASWFTRHLAPQL